MRLALSNLSNCKFCKKESLFGTKKALLYNFHQEFLTWENLGQEFKKELLSYMKSAPSKLFDLQNFAKKTKMPNFGAKNPYLVFFIKNALFENFIAKIFSKIIVIFQISTLKFVKLQTVMKKQNCLDIRPKMSYWVFMK